MFKKLCGLLFVLGVSVSFAFAGDQYLYFYGNTCSHCIKVEEYFEANGIEKDFEVTKYEVFQNAENRELLGTYLTKLNLAWSQIGTPFMVVEGGSGLSYVLGDRDIIDYFSALKKGEKAETSGQMSGGVTLIDEEAIAKTNPLKFLGIMIPMAIGDSINPCAFAVMLLLLSTILTKTKSKKKTILSGFLFSFAIFLSYFLIGLGVYKVLGYANITSGFKRVVGILGILIGLANLKDFFRYGEGFLMEVPLAWRPRMMKLIQSAVSPVGVFVIGVLVSLFLLPCSSGPYFVILGLLKSEQVSISGLGIGYLLIYNFIFILPMLVITFLVGTGQSTVEKLAKMKNKNTKYMHLLIGLLMCLLGVYVIGSMYFDWLNIG